VKKYNSNLIIVTQVAHGPMSHNLEKTCANPLKHHKNIFRAHCVAQLPKRFDQLGLAALGLETFGG
jgi:hypothetical protein